MKHFKSPNVVAGVTFIEVMLTIFVIGMLLSSVFLLQERVFGTIVLASARLRAVYAMEGVLFQASQDRMLEKKPAKETNVEHLKISYGMEKPKKDSSMQRFSDLYIERVQCKWGQEQETMIALVYKPEKKKKT